MDGLINKLLFLKNRILLCVFCFFIGHIYCLLLLLVLMAGPLAMFGG